ncbi:BRMS1L [Cordylochernes scorpioides]|uniref:BRMS1L n=1 Tax=Cordylochernes scorpioides TaxID=51811 RepID=A0ABY6K525_9ARAC|nr:BRMS1L [Cordylochernes scorpioides]
MSFRERYYQERLQLNKQKLEEVKAGRATEYLNPLAELEDDMRVRIHVTDRLMQLREQSVEVQRDAEIYASDRNFHNEVALCWDSIKAELEDKMRHLEEDRTNIDIHSDLWNEQSNHKKNKKKFHSIEKKKKPITSKIVEDWAIIRKSMKNNKPKTEYGGGIENICRARFTDGKLTYRGDTYAKGDRITVEKVQPDRALAHLAQLVSVNTSEVLIEQSDGEYSRLSIADLQAGRCWLYRSSPTYT